MIPSDSADAGISKSEAKRQHKALQEFVKELIDTATTQVAQLDLPEDIENEIASARKMSRSALKRQIGFIAKKMDRELERETIEQAVERLASLKRPAALANARFHLLERWRDSLIRGDDELLETLCNEHGAERQRLRQLVRLARREEHADTHSGAARLLFQYLKSL